MSDARAQVNGKRLVDTRFGAVGLSARGYSVLAHLRPSSKQKAERLRALLAEDFPPPLLAWGALRGVAPNTAPWSPFGGVIDRL